MPVLTSLHNPLVKDVAALRERRARDRTGRTLVEGRDEIALAFGSGARAADLLYCPGLWSRGDSPDLLGRGTSAGARLVEVDERVFRKLAYREHPDGWLCVFHFAPRRLADLRLKDPALLLVADAVEKPGNLGAMLRTADAAGVDAVIACPPRTDWGNPNVVRASKGAVFAVQVASASAAEAVAWLRARRVTPVLATPEAKLAYAQADLSDSIAIVVGAEAEGIGPEWRASGGTQVSIPMFGRVNSLNVSIATALLLYEAVRQRGVQ